MFGLVIAWSGFQAASEVIGCIWARLTWPFFNFAGDKNLLRKKYIYLICENWYPFGIRFQKILIPKMHQAELKYQLWQHQIKGHHNCEENFSVGMTFSTFNFYYLFNNRVWISSICLSIIYECVFGWSIWMWIKVAECQWYNYIVRLVHVPP